MIKRCSGKGANEDNLSDLTTLFPVSRMDNSDRQAIDVGLTGGTASGT